MSSIYNNHINLGCEDMDNVLAWSCCSSCHEDDEYGYFSLGGVDTGDDIIEVTCCCGNADAPDAEDKGHLRRYAYGYLIGDIFGLLPKDDEGYTAAYRPAHLPYSETFAKWEAQ